MNLLFNSHIVNLLLKTNVGEIEDLILLFLWFKVLWESGCWWCGAESLV